MIRQPCPAPPHETPSVVTDDEGEVLVDGPGGHALAMTPEAAAQTAERLRDGVAAARDQRDQPPA